MNISQGFFGKVSVEDIHAFTWLITTAVMLAAYFISGLTAANNFWLLMVAILNGYAFYACIFFIGRRIFNALRGRART